MKIGATTDMGIDSGDVIELDVEGNSTTALVLLATELGIIVDLLDDATPVVIAWEDLRNVRVFSPVALAA